LLLSPKPSPKPCSISESGSRRGSYEPHARNVSWSFSSGP
jgi:hypothetical protein